MSLIREMKIKTTIKYHYAPIRMTKIVTPIPLNDVEGVEQQEFSFIKNI